MGSINQYQPLPTNESLAKSQFSSSLFASKGLISPKKIKYGPTPASFRIFIAKLFTNSITTDALSINWAYLHLVDEACLHIRGINSTMGGSPG